MSFGKRFSGRQNMMESQTESRVFARVYLSLQGVE